MGVNMTYQELIDELRDLGFEEDSTMTEYNEITAHAINRAANLAFDTIVVPLEGYYKRELSTEEEEWKLVRPETLTAESDPDTVIGIPDNMLKPMALLTAHYLWLDDDMEKAIIYYNEWETFANNILNACQSSAKAKIITFGWGW